MKKFEDPIDDLFRDALEDHRMTPSEEAKKVFLKDVMQEVPPPAGSGRRGLLLLSVLLILAVGGYVIHAMVSDHTGSKTPTLAKEVIVSDPSATQVQSSSVATLTNPVPGQPDPAKYTRSTPAEPVIQAISPNRDIAPKQPESAHRVITTKIPKTTPSEATLTGQTAKPAVNPEPPAAVISTPAADAPEFPAPVSSEPQKPDVSKNVTEPSNDVPVKVMAPVRNPDSVPAMSDSTRRSVDPAPSPTRRKTVNRSPWIPSVGLFNSPEWMFNTLEGTKFVNHFGVEGIFRFGQFSIRTGAGLSIAKGTNEVIVEYNDFVGAYNKLDSIDFNWDNVKQDYVPTMYLSKKDVWDSLMKLDYAKVVKRYTYLEIPMIMGYDFLESGRLSLGVRVGPVMSILLATKQISAAYDPGAKRIVSVNDIAPQQVSLNWQAMGGFNLAIRLSKQLGFEVEPWVKYYFNTVYEKPANNEKPWSAGFRTAFVIKF